MIAAGAFGEIDTVKGAMRTRGRWVAFEIANARARITPFAPRTVYEPVTFATGRRFDRNRLRAAFDSCAA